MMTMGPAKKVMIDPGHGGLRDGAKYGWADEDDCNLQIGFYLDYELRLAGIDTRLTREADVELAPGLNDDLAVRVEIARQMAADLFVSLHFDANHNVTAHGSTVHIHPNAGEATRRAAALIDQALRTQVPGHLHRGICESDFYVLRETGCPAVLVECEFLSDPDALEWVRQPENLRAIARAIAGAVEAF